MERSVGLVLGLETVADIGTLVAALQLAVARGLKIWVAHSLPESKVKSHP